MSLRKASTSMVNRRGMMTMSVDSGYMWRINLQLCELDFGKTIYVLSKIQ